MRGCLPLILPHWGPPVVQRTLAPFGTNTFALRCRDIYAAPGPIHEHPAGADIDIRPRRLEVHFRKRRAACGRSYCRNLKTDSYQYVSVHWLYLPDRNNPGSLATFTAMRRASSKVSTLAISGFRIPIGKVVKSKREVGRERKDY